MALRFFRSWSFRGALLGVVGDKMCAGLPASHEAKLEWVHLPPCRAFALVVTTNPSFMPEAFQGRCDSIFLSTLWWNFKGKPKGQPPHFFLGGGVQFFEPHGRFWSFGSRPDGSHGTPGGNGRRHGPSRAGASIWRVESVSSFDFLEPAEPGCCWEAFHILASCGLVL